MMGSIIRWEEFLPTLVAKMGRAGGTLHVKATFNSFYPIGTIWTTLSIFQNPLQGYSIMLSGNRICHNPGILGLTILFLFLRCSKITSTKLESGLGFTNLSMFLSRNTRFDAFETEFTPRLVTALAKNKDILGILGSFAHADVFWIIILILDSFGSFFGTGLGQAAI
eukprot:CAMPEP_0118682972 /NCGR_PEP_ID=MMETSP0800-20121206/5780_1 /TAXON_ID=210618 ORGANISM="Striatella unipunctata, Strain CCMP2910" /NCGR_SAMPLE_ID=MMETSP0800 /ASSEMBLY_ACC=CAM_ASM_000638 /LENGTH=166 /DNA_ID=CAMNT_0006579417 /DNA_START=312 /DNA_END=812 /DNA_ORIENTATION=-